jgi:hypothetical protein
MLGFIRALKFGAAIVATTVMLLGMSIQSQAQSTGSVHIKVLKVGFIVGVGVSGISACETDLTA